MSAIPLPGIAEPCVYVAGVVFALAASGIFHMADPHSPMRSVLRRVDHADLFLIAAS